MQVVSLNDKSHNFQKTNLVTLRDASGMHDTYECSHCGLSGKRYGMNEFIVVKKIIACTNKPTIVPQNNLGKVIMLHPHVTMFGFELEKEYDRVPCPAEYMDKYSDDIWVYSEKRGEPIRLLSHEAQKL